MYQWNYSTILLAFLDDVSDLRPRDTLKSISKTSLSINSKRPFEKLTF
jgi:hypothetical protein